MRWRAWVGGRFLLRRLSRDLAGLRAAVEQQNVLLARLADQFAPALPTTTREDAKAAGTGVDYLDEVESGLAAAYIAKVERDTGHTPTDDEVLTYLADEKTIDLQQRLAERAKELDRQHLGDWR